MFIAIRPACAEIALDSLVQNLRAIKKHAGRKKIIAIVKDDAYGHGAKEVVEAIDADVDYYGVACLSEALALKKNTSKKLLLLGGIFPGEENNISDGIIPVAYNFNVLEQLERSGRNMEIDVEFDTGMGRTGFLPEETTALISFLKRSRRLRLHGAMTHFSSADSNRQFTEKQTKMFLALITLLREKGLNPSLIHSANSAGIFHPSENIINAVRPGIMLYGGYPADTLRKKIRITPVMTFKTTIIHIKKVKRGTPISYGMTYKAKRSSVIGTIAAGYGDGYPRHLSNKGLVCVSKKGIAPVIGRVCMDMTMIDLTHVPNARIGDEVILWGKGAKEVHPDGVAAKAGTISYELFCGLSPRVKRIYRERS